MVRKPNQPGNWAILFLEVRFPWPETETLLTFRGHNVWLLPATEDCYPMVAIE